MTTESFNDSVNAEIRRFRDAESREERIEKQYQEVGYHPDNAQQGEPTSFSAWLEANNDSIEPLDRTESAAQWFDEKSEHENDLRQESIRDFETWETDQQGE